MPSAQKERVAYSPGEFAALFGKSQSWGYRQVYAGMVAVVTQRGRILVPASEVERLLKSAGIYIGRENASGGRKRKKLSERDLSIWEKFIKAKKEGVKNEATTSATPSRKRPRWKMEGSAARQKLASRWATH